MTATGELAQMFVGSGGLNVTNHNRHVNILKAPPK